MGLLASFTVGDVHLRVLPGLGKGKTLWIAIVASLVVGAVVGVVADFAAVSHAQSDRDSAASRARNDFEEFQGALDLKAGQLTDAKGQLDRKDGTIATLTAENKVLTDKLAAQSDYDHLKGDLEQARSDKGKLQAQVEQLQKAEAARQQADRKRSASSADQLVSDFAALSKDWFNDDVAVPISKNNISIVSKRKLSSSMDAPEQCTLTLTNKSDGSKQVKLITVGEFDSVLVGTRKIQVLLRAAMPGNGCFYNFTPE